MKIIFTALMFLLIAAFSPTPTFSQSNGSTPPPKQKNPPKEKREDRYLRKLKASMNYQNRVTRNYAVKLASKFPGEFNYSQISNIFDYVKENWKYVDDPKNAEYFARASDTIENDLAGDCDDFAILLGALLVAIGGETRITFAYGEDSGHAFTEVLIGKDSKALQKEAVEAIAKHYRKRFRIDAINCRRDEDGNLWLNLDWFAKHPGADIFEHDEGVIYYPRENFYEKYKIVDGEFEWLQ